MFWGGTSGRFGNPLPDGLCRLGGQGYGGMQIISNTFPIFALARATLSTTRISAAKRTPSLKIPESIAMPEPESALEGLTGARRLWAFVPIAIAIGMATLDGAIANTALPTMALNLHATPANSIWVINAYQLAIVTSVLPLSALGERVSYRRIYTIGLAIFTLASLLCALSSSLTMLVAARVLQGFGASGIMSVNAALVRFIFPARHFGKGIGLNALVVAVTSAIGPTVASGILAIAPWPWLFAVNVPLGVAALAAGLTALPDNPRATHKFDFVSAGLSAATLGLFVLTISEGGHQAALGLVVLALVAAGVCAWLLVRRQATHPAPILPIDLFRSPVFALSALTASCSFAAQGLAYVSLPFYLQHTLGRTQVETGLLITPWPVVVAIMAPIAGHFSDRYPAGILGGIGLATMCVGLGSFAFLPDHPATLDIVWRMMVCGLGFGFFQTPNMRAIMSNAPPHRSGGASGIVATARLMGQTTGAALVALCFGISADHGAMAALILGSVFSGAASIVSFLRMLPRRAVLSSP
jgi:MFS transporter, DHA2 family, multidrug resistance protein